MSLIETANLIASSTIEFARNKTLRVFWSVMNVMTDVRLDKDEKALKGSFAGKDNTTYETTLKLADNGKIATWSCNCKAHDRDPHAPCKHAVALAWRWENRTLEDRGYDLAIKREGATPSHYWVGGVVIRETEKAILIEVNGKSAFFPKDFVTGNDVEGYLIPNFLMDGKNLPCQPKFIPRKAVG